MTRTVDSVLSIDVSFQMPFAWEGCREGKAPPPVAFQQVVNDTTSQVELKRGLIHASQADFRLRCQRRNGRLPPQGQEPVRFRCSFPVSPLLHQNPGITSV
jgi:hypothetical protein